MKRIYLDYAATTPVDPAVLKVVQSYFSVKFGNAGSLHSFGQEAVAAVDESREKIAKAIGAYFEEIIFTGSATEANNLALRGVIKGIMNNELRIGNSRHRKNSIIHNSLFIIPRIIVSAIEHESILETCRDLEREGAEVIYLPVNRNGVVNLDKLKSSLNNRTILVSIMAANNEIGTTEPIPAIAEIIADFRLHIKNSNKKNLQSSIFNFQYPLFHTDAAQAFQYLDYDVKKLGVDLMTLSAHKIYGPKGIGVLYINSKILNLKSSILNPIITGGGQEFGLRSGTENIPSVVGFAKAAEMAVNIREKETKRISGLRDYFWKQIKKTSPEAQLNGPAKNRLPNNLNIYFPGHKAEDLLIKLDLAGVAVSAGSACSARGTGPSHVLKACGFPPERIKSSLRITLGRLTTKAEINEAVKRTKSIIKN